MIEIIFPYEWPERLAWLVAMFTMVIGLALMVMPARFGGWLGLQTRPGTVNGLSEIRAALGGVMIGLGLACLLLAQPFTYFALGMAYFGAVLGRIVSFAFDRSFNAHCIVAAMFEAGCAWLTLGFAGSALGLF